ncbi:hypothetical protein ZEAMMB73_Zm00001d004962 [Zea mays]|uniref:Uncharacterized protein n=1 Tax=Zea mays TaxID=4577 RepID=A0A1D6EIC1_MAIZE|nr:hypothetical protein ZEAMMB73_Zm00001d004962 [Zea mays]
MDDCQLVNTSAESSNSEMVYGSEEDENDALDFLSAISEHDTELIETVMCHFREKFENLPEKFNGVEEQLFQEFSLDDLFPLVAPLFMETPHSCSMYAEKAEQCFDEVATDPSQIVDLCYNEGNERLFYKLLIDNIEEPLNLSPDQLQKALRKTFSAEKKKSKIRKAWDETKVIYSVAWGCHCCWAA